MPGGAFSCPPAEPARVLENGRSVAVEVVNVGDALLAADESLELHLAVRDSDDELG
jgi:hypothetical protein